MSLKYQLKYNIEEIISVKDDFCKAGVTTMICARSMTFSFIVINFKFLSSQRGGKGEERSRGEQRRAEKSMNEQGREGDSREEKSRAAEQAEQQEQRSPEKIRGEKESREEENRGGQR